MIFFEGHDFELFMFIYLPKLKIIKFLSAYVYIFWKDENEIWMCGLATGTAKLLVFIPAFGVTVSTHMLLSSLSCPFECVHDIYVKIKNKKMKKKKTACTQPECLILCLRKCKVTHIFVVSNT